MSASLSMNLFGTKVICNYSGTEVELSEMITCAALSNDLLAECVTKAAAEVETKRRMDSEINQMINK